MNDIQKEIDQYIPEAHHTQILNDALFTVLNISGSKEESAETTALPQRAGGAAVCICLEGQAELIVDAISYEINKGDMFIIFPRSICQPIKQSPDFISHIIGVNPSFFTSIDINSTIPLYLFIKEHPCISLNDEDLKTILELSTMLTTKANRDYNPYKDAVSVKLLEIIFCEVCNIYMRQKPIVQRTRKRDEELFAKFLYLVEKHFRTQRRVDFYAQQLCITPKYMSQVIKNVSSRSATDWIAHTVIVNAKTLLKSSGMTVQQIAEHLNFPNPSFFGQYFKRHTGITPKSFQSRKA